MQILKPIFKSVFQIAENDESVCYRSLDECFHYWYNKRRAYDHVGFCRQQYRTCGTLHRLDGPAIESYERYTDQWVPFAYWVDGVTYGHAFTVFFTDYKQAVERYKLLLQSTEQARLETDI